MTFGMCNDFIIYYDAKPYFLRVGWTYWAAGEYKKITI
jgi:hypothetical protein